MPALDAPRGPGLDPWYVNTLVEVKGLFRDDVLVEIDAIAAPDADRR